VRLLRRRSRAALHTIGEAEAYARLHGGRGEDIVSVEPLPPEPPQPLRQIPASLTGESLRQAFERRLRKRGSST
jgi:hypothetical protein